MELNEHGDAAKGNLHAQTSPSVLPIVRSFPSTYLKSEFCSFVSDPLRIERESSLLRNILLQVLFESLESGRGNLKMENALNTLFKLEYMLCIVP